jgi:hypothetical protein
VGYSVSIELETDWAIDTVDWSFWDGEVLSCEWRECARVSHPYKKKWLYKIEARVTYLDGSPASTASKKINIIDN